MLRSGSVGPWVRGPVPRFCIAAGAGECAAPPELSDPGNGATPGLHPGL